MLNVVTADTALNLILNHTPSLIRTESVPLEQALGRIAGEDILSPEDLPAFSRSTVDGYAVIAEDTHGCSESIPAMLICDGEIQMGELPAQPLQNGHCIRIPTGGNLPPEADAVSMIEYTDDIGDEFRYIYKPVSSLENVNARGDDIRRGDPALTRGTLLHAGNIALLAALGIREVPVIKPVRAGIISTGDELVEYYEKPQGAQIRNINSVMLAAQVQETGACPVVYPIIKDDPALLKAAVEKALSECDIVLISGGSSVGEKDNTSRVLQATGEVLFHGISIKPGKPTLFAMAQGKPLFGLPGHPQAAFFIFRLLVAPCIRSMTGTQYTPVCVQKILSTNIPSNHGREEIMPVALSGESAVPVHARSGVISVLSRTDGYIRIDRNAEGLPKGAAVDVFLL